jgi:hypothetical protein
MVKCYFYSARKNSRCAGFTKDYFVAGVGTKTYFEEWYLLPADFNPMTRSRSRIVEESRRAYGASMRAAADADVQRAGSRFFPVPVFAAGNV